MAAKLAAGLKWLVGNVIDSFYEPSIHLMNDTIKQPVPRIRNAEKTRRIREVCDCSIQDALGETEALRNSENEQTLARCTPALLVVDA
jgi:hypothetical protein